MRWGRVARRHGSSRERGWLVRSRRVRGIPRPMAVDVVGDPATGALLRRLTAPPWQQFASTW
jgi:hypothetical protein